MSVAKKRAAERKAKADRDAVLADYCRWLKAWSCGANGTMLPVDLAESGPAQLGYEQGMEARMAASVKMRAKYKVSREELGAYLAKQG